jgi:hypothetical protein
MKFVVLNYKTMSYISNCKMNKSSIYNNFNIAKRIYLNIKERDRF